MSLKSSGGSASVPGNSMPVASFDIAAGYCQIFSEYLDIALGLTADVQLNAILEIT